MSEEEYSRMEKRVTKRFNRACADFALLEDGDKVLIALSGGKDSMLLLHLMAQRSRLYKPKIEVEAAHVVMDNIPYESNRTSLEIFCRNEGVKFHLLHTAFDETTDRRKTKCFLCAWYRRKALFSFAQKNGFNKLALGHHQDDILTTLLMNLIFEGSFDTMAPRLDMKHYSLALIRPLALVCEKETTALAKHHGFSGIKVHCPYENVTQRQKTSQMLQLLETQNPEVRQNLWRALEKKPEAFCRVGLQTDKT